MRVNRSSKDKNFNTRMTIFPMKHQTSSCNVYVQIEHQNRMIGTLTFLCTSNLDQLYRLNMFEWNIKWEWFVVGRLNIYTNIHLNMLERNIEWEWFVVVWIESAFLDRRFLFADSTTVLHQGNFDVRIWQPKKQSF